MSATEREKERPTTLTTQQYIRCLGLAMAFVEKHGSIRNKQIREIAGIGYDQAIGFFKRATNEKRLTREGVSSATRYVMAKTPH